MYFHKCCTLNMYIFSFLRQCRSRSTPPLPIKTGQKRCGKCHIFCVRFRPHLSCFKFLPSTYCPPPPPRPPSKDDWKMGTPGVQSPLWPRRGPRGFCKGGKQNWEVSPVTPDTRSPGRSRLEELGAVSLSYKSEILQYQWVPSVRRGSPWWRNPLREPADPPPPPPPPPR